MKKSFTDNQLCLIAISIEHIIIKYKLFLKQKPSKETIKLIKRKIVKNKAILKNIDNYFLKKDLISK